MPIPPRQNIVVTLSVAHGTLTLLTNVTGGITAGQITGGANGTASITLTATQNQINATLAAATASSTARPPIITARTRSPSSPTTRASTATIRA